MAVTGVLPWHHSTWQQLVRLADSGRLPHALLISGAHGVGKQQLAEADRKSVV